MRLSYEIITKMSSISKKRVLDHKVKKLKVLPTTTPILDIEDSTIISCSVMSEHFSPTHTPNLRKLNADYPKQLLHPQKKSKLIKSCNEPSTSRNMTTKCKEFKTKKWLTEDEEASNNLSASKNFWVPARWEEMLNNIRKMRSRATAPVDSMGCHKCCDEEADDKTQRFHKLVALMLSSQTKDEITYEAMQRLKVRGLTPFTLVEMKLTDLENVLKPVSFYKNKSKYLQKTARILIDKFDCDIPNNIKDLLSLPGVGPKMAHICMATAWNETTGIGVDVHVHRIANRIKWVPSETKEPEHTREALEMWLPRDLWSEVNHLLVGFGQTICTALRPRCSDCLNVNICPSSVGKEVSSKTEKIANLSTITKAKFIKKQIQK